MGDTKSDKGTDADAKPPRPNFICAKCGLAAPYDYYGTRPPFATRGVTYVTVLVACVSALCGQTTLSLTLISAGGSQLPHVEHGLPSRRACSCLWHTLLIYRSRAHILQAAGAGVQQQEPLQHRRQGHAHAGAGLQMRLVLRACLRRHVASAGDFSRHLSRLLGRLGEVLDVMRASCLGLWEHAVTQHIFLITSVRTVMPRQFRGHHLDRSPTYPSPMYAGCSMFYTKRFCKQCIAANISEFPPEIQQVGTSWVVKVLYFGPRFSLSPQARWRFYGSLMPMAPSVFDE